MRVTPFAAALIGCLIFIAIPALAQDEEDPLEPGPWDVKGLFGLNLAQSAFTENWSGGDTGTASWVLNADLYADRQFTRTFNWKNSLLLAYGQTSRQESQDGGGQTWSTPDKTTDLIQFESLGRFTMDRIVDPYVAFQLDSQFIDDTHPLGRLLFTPVRLAETAGVSRVFQKTEDRELLSRFGFGLRQHIGRTFADDTGTSKTTNVTHEGGFEWTTDALYPLFDDKVEYRGKLRVFLPVFFNESDNLDAFDEAAMAFDPGREAIADFWKDPSVNWQNTFTSKITGWLSVILYAQLVYEKFDAAVVADTSTPIEEQIATIDSGIRKAGQFKQTLAIGLTYRYD